MEDLRRNYYVFGSSKIDPKYNNPQIWPIIVVKMSELLHILWMEDGGQKQTNRQLS